MTTKMSISVTGVHAKLISNAVKSGQYASASEVVREALRQWRREEVIDDLIDEGIASGFGKADRSVETVIAAARKQSPAKKKRGA
ncbi:MAG: hypothetical protein B7Y90_17345 [Alphaproteobacteria bacterium 32-64-14]|nr:MAG: hypothetical protein B7Y90_17345 [Alphaproteobacteria bacterium 32-64-14]